MDSTAYELVSRMHQLFYFAMENKRRLLHVFLMILNKKNALTISYQINENVSVMVRLGEKIVITSAANFAKFQQNKRKKLKKIFNFVNCTLWTGKFREMSLIICNLFFELIFFCTFMLRMLLYLCFECWLSKVAQFWFILAWEAPWPLIFRELEMKPTQNSIEQNSLHSAVSMPTVLGRKRYMYGLSKHAADINIVLISSGLSNVIFSTGPMYALDGVSTSFTNFTIANKMMRTANERINGIHCWQMLNIALHMTHMQEIFDQSDHHQHHHQC